MNRFVLIAISILSINLGTSCKNSKDTPSKENWISLFNGENLDGWHVKITGYELNDNSLNTFVVDQGVMRVSYKEYDTFTNQFGHIFYKAPFKNYKIRLQYRFIGEQLKGGAGWAHKNSGIMIHSQSPESMELNQEFPVSLEVQFLGGLVEGEERPTGNLCTPGTHVEMQGELITDHCIKSVSETIYNNSWVNAEILVSRDSIVHKINGREVMTYKNPIIGGNFNTFPDKEGESLTEGYISLQSESHPIEFRNIEILELNK